MTTHTSIVWKIPWTVEAGGLQSMGLQRVGHDLSDLALMVFTSAPCELASKLASILIPSGSFKGEKLRERSIFFFFFSCSPSAAS